MKGLASPWAEVDGAAGLDSGAEAAVGAGGFAGICAAGATELVAGGGLADGAGEIVTAGGLARSCASAPEIRRGRAVNAPVNKTRSVMRQDPTTERRASCASKRFTMHIKVTNLSPRGVFRRASAVFAHYAAWPTNAKAAPRGGLSRAPRRSQSMPGESLLLRPRRKPAKPRPQTQSAISAHADDSGDA
jgi:hypothetical protein